MILGTHPCCPRIRSPSRSGGLGRERDRSPGVPRGRREAQARARRAAHTKECCDDDETIMLPVLVFSKNGACVRLVRSCARGSFGECHSLPCLSHWNVLYTERETHTHMNIHTHTHTHTHTYMHALYAACFSHCSPYASSPH